MKSQIIGVGFKRRLCAAVMAGVLAISSLQLTIGRLVYADELEPVTADVSDDYYDTDADFRKNVDDALSYVKDGMSDLQKAIVLHDWLAVNCEYDNDNFAAGTIPDVTYTTYGALVNHMTVCQGYSLAYRYLLKKVGITSYIVGSDGINHTWNLVKIGDCYYHVDLTWDDSGSSHDIVGWAQHDFMLLSKDAFINVDRGMKPQPHGDGSDWLLYIEDDIMNTSKATNYAAYCAEHSINDSDTTYDTAFWQNTNVPLVFDEDSYDDCYYLDMMNGYVKKTTFSSITAAGSNVSGAIDLGLWGYSGLFKIGDRLYYNDLKKIYSIKQDGTDVKTEFQAADSAAGSYNMYGIAYKQGKVYYSLYADYAATNAGRGEVLVANLDSTLTPDNTSYSYTTINDEAVTSKAAKGRPKVLYFYDTTSEAGKALLESLNEHSGGFAKADFYAVEIGRHSKDEVAAFYGSLGGSKDWISYTYDTTDASLDSAKAYLNATESLTAPAIVYIDASNYVRHTDTNVTDWAAIAEGLRTYCGYDYYWVDYVLDSGNNNTANPALYRGSGDYFPLKDAVKDGYRFDGWYFDSEYTQKAEEISCKLAKDITLYAKWSEGVSKLNKDNFSQTYRSISGQTLSSEAVDSPKLLVFFMTDDPNSQSTIADISSSIDSLSGVEVLAVEVNLTSLSTTGDPEGVKTFKDTYGCDDIAFAYDVASTNYGKAEDYVTAAVLSDFNTPVICYIDADNRLQWVTMGAQTGDQVLENLKDYCDYEGGSGSDPTTTYKIEYELDGGTNASSNPTTYTAGTETFALADATREGYRFDGWYKESSFTTKVTQIVKGSTGDITLYAKWTKLESILGKSNLYQTYYNLQNDVLESTAKDNYPKLLIFFNKDETASVDTIKSISDNSDLIQQADIYAIESGNATKDEVSAFADNYSALIEFAYNTGTTTNAEKAQAYADAALLTDISYPLIAYIDKDNKLQKVTTGEQTGAAILENLKNLGEEPDPGESIGPFTFTTIDGETVSSKADGKPKLLLFYIYNSGKSACKDTMSDLSDNIGKLSGVDLYAIECNKGSRDDVSSFKKNYAGLDKIPFAYDTDGTVNKPAMQAYELAATGKNVSLYTYPLICYIDAKDNFKHLTTGKATVDDILGNLSTYCGYTPEGGSDPSDPDTPVETYKITYVLNGGTNNSSNPETYTNETATISLKNPTRDGYKFDGWYKDADYKEKVTQIAKGSTGDITLYAKWIERGNMTGLSIEFIGYDSMKDSKCCYKFTGAAIKPDINVYNNDTLLTVGTDYTVAYKNNTKPGDASVTIKGRGSYTGASAAVGFTILKADIDTDTSHPDKMTVYKGAKVTPVILNGAKQLSASDYELDGIDKSGKYSEPGTYTLTVKGRGNYDENSSFTIDVTVLDKAEKLAVTVSRDFKPVYTGTALDINELFTSGKITVTDAKDKTKNLTLGTDYTVVCKSNLKNAGTVKFTVIGMGLYAGSVNKTFKINPLKVTDASSFTVSYDKKTCGYNPAGTTLDDLTVKYAGDILRLGVDYKVSYSGNKKAGENKAQVKITFMGNYKGSKPYVEKFTINAAKLDASNTDAEVVAPDKVYAKAGAAYKSVPLVTIDGATVPASNYTVSYEWAVENSNSFTPGNKVRLEEGASYARVKVTIVPKGANYTAGADALTGEYYVRRAAESAVDLSKAKITFTDKDGKTLKSLEYNGGTYFTPDGVSNDPNAVYVKVTVKGSPDPIDSKLYTVTWTNATAKGKAVVIINGNGTGAVGGKSQSISIKPMAFKGKLFKLL